MLPNSFFFCNLLTHEVLRSSSERVCVFQIELEFGIVGFEERVKPECAKRLNVQAKNSLIPIYYEIEGDVNVAQVTSNDTGLFLLLK